VVIIEDLAYFGMDFRKDYSSRANHPISLPLQSTQITIFCLFQFESFQLCGSEIGLMLVSNKLFNLESTDLLRNYTTLVFGRALIYGTLYALSAGTAHSAQYAMAAMLKATNDGNYNFVEVVRDYGDKARS